MPKPLKSEKDIRVGDYFEDCAFHPCLCILVGDGEDKDGVRGISLVNGSIKSCSVGHCGLRLLTVEEAIYWKLNGPADQVLEEKFRWWN